MCSECLPLMSANYFLYVCCITVQGYIYIEKRNDRRNGDGRKKPSSSSRLFECHESSSESSKLAYVLPYTYDERDAH